MLKLISMIGIASIGFMTLTGCASITSGTTEKINVNTGLVSGAHCSLTNNKGRWSVSSTPSTVVVDRSSANLAVNCNKPGYKTAYTQLDSKTNPTSLGNIVMIGGLVGEAVDRADGAAYKYPEEVNLTLQHGMV